MILIILAFDKYEDYLYVLYLLYGLPMIALTYMASFMFEEESSGQNFIVALFFIVGALGGSIIVFLRFFEDLTQIAKGISYFFRLVPLFSWSNGYSILLNRDTLYFIDNPDANRFEEIKILAIDYVGLDIVYLIFTFFIYILVIFLIEMFEKKWAINKFQNNSPDLVYIQDEEVKKEISKANNYNIQDHSDMEKTSDNYSIVVKNIEKTYQSCCSESNKAINNMSFTLKYGDCFAMLGVNGAGKSSMFKCLTNQILPEKGDIIINNLKVSSDFESCRKLVGYCPQFDAIFEDMTVKENLLFYSNIKGIPSDMIENITTSIIKDMNLSEYTDKISGNLSGGNKRKLSVAIAMIGNPAIMLLDEPSAGMDPEARRAMWSVIHKITKISKKSSVILTTHSMEEAETLCHKMGIMVKGQFKCFGSAAVIKENYGKVSNFLFY